MAEKYSLFTSTDSEVSNDEKDNYEENKDSNQASLSDNQAAAKMQIFLNYLGKVETQYECSGVCEKKKIYYFSDINNGVPT